ncbi:MAG TPA: OmpH family outer membrane protein [Gammaproteobacteria bacterium]|jgi:outer membrane protein|nr:OmpH family outer membrane protein [Gammaproteobacteria bacterium]
MMIGKKCGVFATALFLAGSVGVCQAAAVAAVDANYNSAPIKVAVLNVQSVLEGSKYVDDLRKKLEGQFRGRQTAINNEQKTLQDEIDKLKKDEPTMGQKEKDAAEKKISNERAGLVKEVVSYQKDLQTEQQKIMKGILAKLNAIVSSLANKKSYYLVLDSQAVVFAKDGVDLTKDVSDQFNGKNS